MACVAVSACGKISQRYDGSVKETQNSIAGQWQSPCLFNTKVDKNGKRVDKSTRQTVVAINDGKMKSITKGYKRENCEPEKHTFTLVAEWDYKVLDENFSSQS